jgi:hypothetical protein
MKKLAASIVLVCGFCIAEANGTSLSGEWIAPGVVWTFADNGTFHIVVASRAAPKDVFGEYELADSHIYLLPHTPRRPFISMLYRIDGDTLVFTMPDRVFRLVRHPSI